MKIKNNKFLFASRSVADESKEEEEASLDESRFISCKSVDKIDSPSQYLDFRK